MHSWGQVTSIVVCRSFLPAVAQGHFTQQHQASVVGPAGAAVVGRLAHHVGEVDSLAEHVAGHWCLGRGDAQALRQDSHKVRQSGSVPQQLLVMDLLFESFVFLLLVQGINLLNLEPVVIMSGGMGVLNIFLQFLEELRLLINGLNLSLQLQVI